jgi:nucleoside-diphosphate-sugar epimerase
MHSKTKTIIITGANGFVGSALVEHFAQKGWQIRALVREPDHFTARKNTTYFAYDMQESPASAIFNNADYLIHTAYVKEDRKYPAAYQINIDAAKKLMKQSRKHHISKNVFMSSMSAHAEAVSGYAKQKFEIESLFSTKKDASIRSGLVIGNGGLIKQIVQFMKTRHIAPLIDGGEQPLQIIAIYDLVRAIEGILESNLHGTFAIGTPEVYTYREFYQTIRRKLNIKAVIIPVPFWVPLYVIRIINWLHLPLGVTEDNLWGLKKLKSFETLPTLKKLGIKLDTLEDALDKKELFD